MATKTSGKDKLKKTAAKSARKPAAKDKERKPWPLSPEEETQVAKLCQLAHLAGEVDPLVKQHKKSVGATLFNRWTARMFDDKAVPENPDFVIKKKDENGQPIEMDDMKCQLQVKFRKDGLQKVLPDAADLAEDETVEEKLIEVLMSDVVGLTEQNAKKFVDEEVSIDDEVTLAMPLNDMFSQDEETDEGKLWHSIGDKLVDYIQARSKGKTGKVSLPQFTEEEEGAVLVTRQVVRLKDGLFDRACTYCESLDQLRKLLLYINVTIQVSNFDFGMSDEDSVRVERLKGTVQTYLLPAA